MENESYGVGILTAFARQRAIVSVYADSARVRFKFYKTHRYGRISIGSVKR
jgi:hypothetical protein